MTVFWMKRHDGKGKAHAFRKNEGNKSVCGQASFDLAWDLRIRVNGEIYGAVLENKEMCGYCRHHLRGRKP